MSGAASETGSQGIATVSPSEICYGFGPEEVVMLGLV